MCANRVRVRTEGWAATRARVGAKGKCAKILQRDALFEKNAVFSLKYPSALSLFQERICRDSKDARSELFLIGNIYVSSANKEPESVSINILR